MSAAKKTKKKRPYLSKQAAAGRIFDVYAENIDTPVTDAQMVTLTGLTRAQIGYGKRYLRDVVAADEHFMYVAGPHGCFLTRRPEDARGYVKAHTLTAHVQARRLLTGTIQTLVEIDPAAKFVLRGYERLIEDLELLSDVADAGSMTH